MANETYETGKDRFTRRTFLKGAGAAIAAGLVSAPATGSLEARPPSDTPIIGAGLNGRPHRLDNNLELIDVSNTTWVRAFLDVRQKLHNGIHPKHDPDIVALRRAARQKDCKLIVSLKWDFAGAWGKKTKVNVPQPNSTRETALLRCATRYLGNIGAPVDIVVLGNEPMWETPEEDIKVDDSPVVRFTRNVKNHLVQHYDGDPTFLVGAFNRLHDDTIRERQFPEFHRQLFDMVRHDDDIDGADLHIHFDEFEEARNMVATAREELPDAMLTATEFSPVWRYERNKDTPIDQFEAGKQFADEYGVPDGTTAVEYFEAAKENRRPRGELADFVEAMPWYNENHVRDMYDLFDEYDVSVATIGFLQGTEMRNEDWTAGWTPFHINFLFQDALIKTGYGAHPHYVDDYRELARKHGSGVAG